MNEFRIVVCASGGGGNFKSLIESQQHIGFTIIKLIVDRECGAINVAKKSGIEVERIAYKENKSFSEDFINAIPTDVNLIVLAGFLPILPDIICERFKKKIINTHPSLLPKYGGKGMYGVKVQEAVMAAREKKAGCTVHYVTKDIDAGDILLQKEIDVDFSETPWQLGGRVFNEEIKLLPEAIRIIKNQ
jgi:phosphoribosylglycinamide formyltransferase-1